jgi:ubiquinone/menaquinone biosynthesis C-methylase UbiE
MIPGVERYVIRGGRGGYGRLQFLSRARWPDTSAFLDHVGVRAGMSCLDLGCGSADVTFELARLVGPGGHVTGVDMDEVKLGFARESATKQGIANVTFRVANVNDWHEENAYDLAYSRFLLEHLSRPVDLLKRMWAAVRPGGVIAVEDADFDGLFSEPANSGFEFYKRSYPEVLARHGGDSTTGRKLYRYFLEAGIAGPSLRLVQRVDSTGEAKTLSLSTLEATADAIVAEGLASRDEIDASIESLRAFTDDRSTLVGDPRIFQVWAYRP